MSYIVQRPYSVTNQTPKFRVVKFDEWLNFASGNQSHIPAALGEYDNFAEAEKVRGEANRTEDLPVQEDVHNQVLGTVDGTVVQARNIVGDLTF